MNIDLNKFYSITSKIEEATGGQISFDKTSEPNWAEIIQTGRYCRMLNFFDDCIWCYDQGYLLADTLDIPSEGRAELKSSVLSAKALAFIQKGNNHYALNLCLDSISFWNENAEAYCNQGVAYSNLGEYNKSMNAHKRAIELNSKLSQSWNAIGQLLVDNFEDPLNAIDFLDKAIELTNGEDTHAWVNKGNALMRLGKYEEANICWDTAYEIDPQNNIHAILNKAILHLSLNNITEAKILLNDVLETLEPSHKEYTNVVSMLEKIKNEY